MALWWIFTLISAEGLIDALTARAFERVHLQVEVLIPRAHAGVAEFHLKSLIFSTVNQYIEL
jgi:hypothetical protein